jgi:hypothetical protein
MVPEQLSASQKEEQHKRERRMDHRALSSFDLSGRFP